MVRSRSWHLALPALAGLLLACSGSIKQPSGGGNGAGGGGGVGGPGADEQFPAALLQPYAGPPSDVYDNTFVGYAQLKGKVNAIFPGGWVSDAGVDQFAENIGLLGGADFTDHFVEARVATSDFLLAMDALTKDVCEKASAAKTGPFQGVNTGAVADAAGIAKLYTKLLFRAPTAAETTDTSTLYTDLRALPGLTTQDAWSGVCEALMRHPDFLWTLPPSRPSTTGDEKKTLLLVKLAQDLVARPPSDAEIQSFLSGSKSFEQIAEQYLGSPEFHDYAYYKMRIRTESDGTTDSDEPARLWTYLLTSGDRFQNLLTANFGIDTSFQKASRPAYHGSTGVLTMKGFIEHKPGLPHYNYSARVLSDFLGYVFEVPPEVIAMRIGATASSTVDPTSICFTCHQLLTPLAYQRGKWTDDGVYQETDDTGKPIDDSDRNLVAGYPYKGAGLQAFATQAVKKERFVRHTFDAEFNLLFGRPMRYDQDERVLYKQLWDTAGASNGDLRATLKVMLASPQYQGN